MSSDLKTKLLEKELIGADALLKPLTGGVSSDIYLVIDGDKTFVVKQALEKLKVAEDWQADVSRNKYEQRYLKFVHQFRPDAVPVVEFDDEDSGFFTMEYLGDGFLNLKTEMLEGRIDRTAVERVVSALAEVHQKSWGDEDVKARFDTTKNFIELRVSPYFYFLQGKFPELKDIIGENCERLIGYRTCLVHGDFSPKNILYSADRSIILDCEVAWYGNPTFDLAFFINHLLLKSIHLGKPEFKELAVDVNALYTRITGQDLTDRLMEVLPMMLLARVAGKSPAEYLDEAAKQRITVIAVELIRNKPSNLTQLIEALS